MRKLKNAGVVLCLITCFAMLTGVSGCDDQMQDIQNWVENTNKLRATAKQQGEVVPYRQAQFKALKDYFGEINQMVLALGNDANFAARFNTAVSKADLKATCAKVFLTNLEWQTMVERCTRNNFFLCADEVKAYRDMVIGLRARLVPEQQKRFDQTPTCRASFDVR